MQLGGRLVSNTSTEITTKSSVEEAAEAFKIAGSASFSYSGVGASAGSSYESNEGQKEGSKSAKFNQSIAWEGQGGDTLLSNKYVIIIIGSYKSCPEKPVTFMGD